MPDRDSPTAPDTKLASAVDSGAPGLPRGRTGLPADEVRRRQRERLVRGAIAAIAEKGYAAVTVADIVAAARVSRKAFYDHFDDRQGCFLAAATDGGMMVFQRMASAAGGDAGDATADVQLRHAVRAYLVQCAAEPEFTRCIFQELPVTGAAGREVRVTWFSALAHLLRAWHGALLSRRGVEEDPPPPWVHHAAIGAVHEMLLKKLESGTPQDFPAMEDRVVAVFERMLGLPPADG